MKGLVNAAGASEASRVRSITEASSKSGEGKKPARVLLPNNGQAVESVLLSAVQGVEFLETGEERELPGGDTSDRFAQADSGAKLPSTSLGSHLDVQA